MKKLLALVLALTMLLALTACSDTPAEDTPEGGSSSGDSSGNKPSGGKKEDPTVDVAEDLDDLAYVLIYNPQIYDENSAVDRSALSTGDFGSMIDVDFDRADGLDQPSEIQPLSQAEINAGLPLDSLNLEGNRGEGLTVAYDEGDEKEFYCFDSSMDRVKKEFECLYVGEYCNIWTIDGAIDEETAEEYGEDFDEDVYEDVVALFGKPRFVDDVGKVNLMFYPMMSGLGGCFYNGDLYATGELSDREVEQYGCNLDHAMVHLNSDYLRSYSTWMHGTMAHEFQHLICFTNSLEADVYCRTWFNEGMSGYIEEQLYPGAKEDAGHFESLNESGRIRAGQSLYNFESSSSDVGVYGSVYLFAEYISDLAGEEVFEEFTAYWRDSYSDTLCEAEALANAFSKSAFNKIDNYINFPESVDFDSAEEEWMSKLVCSFYLETLNEDSDIPGFDEVDVESLLYDEINAADIEGGGRIIVALSDGEFEIPEDAEDGLVYIGLDEDFEVLGVLE